MGEPPVALNDSPRDCIVLWFESFGVAFNQSDISWC